MIEIILPDTELFDEASQSFLKIKGITLQLEHSLVSLSKWESKWKKAFLSSNKTNEETFDYIKCMTINKNVNDLLYNLISEPQAKEIMEYIQDEHTATFFPNVDKGKIGHDIVTAELIYYWMITLSIPFECRKWHLNKLMTLIRVCATKNGPQKKMSKREIMRQNSSLNAARRAKLGSRG